MKHHFDHWRDVNGGLDDPDGEAHTHCVRCGVKIKMGRKGGKKFLLPDGKWSSKQVPCTENVPPTESPKS